MVTCKNCVISYVLDQATNKFLPHLYLRTRRIMTAPTATSFAIKANEAEVDKDFEKAAELYSKAIDIDDVDGKLFLKRSQMYLKLQRYENAEKDAKRSTQLNSQNPFGYLWQGTALFELERYTDCLEAVKTGLKYGPKDSRLQKLKAQCEDKLGIKKPDDKSAAAPAAEKSAEAKEEKTPGAQEQEDVTTSPPKMPTDPAKIKYDWYQTQTHVIVTIMLRNQKQENLDMDVTEKWLSVTVKQESGTDYSLELDLAHTVKPRDCTAKVTSYKIEIKLKKDQGVHWTNLEGDSADTAAQPKQIADAMDGESAIDPTRKYPTSHHTFTDWEKFAAEVKKEEEEEKPEGDAALNSLFQKIYKDADEDTQKAMVKSFTESAGTVLSTNWKDIGAKNTDIKPPDCMEHKKYEM